MIEREDERLSVTRQCQLVGLNRSTLYYRPVDESAATVALMRRIDELYLKYPFYGSRQMMRHLARDGVRVGRHRVRRLMRLLGLEAIYRKPRSTVANPEHRVYPYLLRGLTIERSNQVWAADITYIPVQDGFQYLVAIMDWASRRVLAWRLSNTMDTEFCLAALAEALEGYGIPEIFNTDQGSQFTSIAFTGQLETTGIRCSMDGRGRCLDNVFIERLWRSFEVRGGIPARVGGRLCGAAGDRRLDRVLQRGATALGPGRADAGGSIRCRRGAAGAGGVMDMGIGSRLQVTRSRERWSTKWSGELTTYPQEQPPPSPYSIPRSRRLNWTRRGGLTTNGIHLNLSLRSSSPTGPPHAAVASGSKSHTGL